MKRLSILILLLVVAGCQPAPPMPVYVSGKVLATMRAFDGNRGIAVQQPDGFIPVIIIGRDNRLDKKTAVTLRTVHTIDDLTGKQVRVYGYQQRNYVIATAVIEVYGTQ
jgi:hypothetical protein